MKTRLTSVTFLLLVVAFGCDIYEEDAAPRTTSETILRTKGSPALINSRAYFNDVFLEGASYRIAKQPVLGSVSVVSSGAYFLYEPADANMTDDDTFTAEIISKGGKRLGVTTMRVTTTDQCGLGPVVTYIKIQKGTSLNLNLLQNDVFCNMPWNDAAVFARGSTNPSGQWLYTLDGNNGTTAKFTYTPSAGFTGKSEFYYDLGVNASPGMETWDDQMRNNWFYYPHMFERYVSVKLVVDVTN